MALHGLSFHVWENLALFAGMLAVGTVLFSAGIFGGGDVKLLAAVSLWADFERVLILLAAVFLFGGLLAVIVITRRLVVGGVGSALRDRSRTLPYGVAIATGTVAVLVNERAMSLHIL